MILFHIHDESSRPAPRRTLNGRVSIVALPFDQLDGVAARDMKACLFDLDLRELPKALRIRRFLAEAKPPALRIFACPRGDHHSTIQAWALGATHLLGRPLRYTALAKLLDSLEGENLQLEPSSTVTATVALEGAFRALEASRELSGETFEAVAQGIDDDIRNDGLEAWLQSIRTHHAGTYQHCLLVTGLATSFGLELGFSSADRGHLTVAALLHDIGKARIDLALLDKPAQLTSEERALFQMHPVWGDEYLAAHSDLPEPIRDVVRHHHEYLDGSGYPDGLRGGEISDLARLVTIADVFAALIERRAYKPPLPAQAAYGILMKMAAEGRIETALVEAFGAVVARCPDWVETVEARPRAPLRVA